MLTHQRGVALPHPIAHSGVASTKNCLGGKNFNFDWATVFCLGYCPSKHKVTRYAKILKVDYRPLPPWLRLWLHIPNVLL